MSKEQMNEENEYNIGRIFIVFSYIKTLLFYGIIGGIAGFFITHSLKGIIISAIVMIAIRYTVFRLIYFIIDHIASSQQNDSENQ